MIDETKLKDITQEEFEKLIKKWDTIFGSYNFKEGIIINNIDKELIFNSWDRKSVV